MPIDYDGIQISEIIHVESPNYLFINLMIHDTAKAGILSLDFYKRKRKTASYSYELKARDKNPNLHQGFDNSDVIYLLMPDRFANGDTANDNANGMHEKVNRSNPLGRHGGDIQGISNQLDYLADLGVTTIWTTPLRTCHPSQSRRTPACTTRYGRTEPG